MKIYKNGIIREATPEEITEMEEARLRYEAEEKHRPLSTYEVQAMFIRQQVNTLTVDDATALRMAAFYPEWESRIDDRRAERIPFSSHKRNARRAECVRLH